MEQETSEIICRIYNSLKLLGSYCAHESDCPEGIVHINAILDYINSDLKNYREFLVTPAPYTSYV